MKVDKLGLRTRLERDAPIVLHCYAATAGTTGAGAASGAPAGVANAGKT